MKWLLFITTWLAAAAAGAQEKRVIHLNKFSQRDGLPSYNVRNLAIDNFGFLWVATQDGVSRFDGQIFTNYSKNARGKHGISGVDVRTIIPDSAGNLVWILPGEEGINAINTVTGEVVLSVPLPGEHTDTWNITMAKTGKDIWVGTSTGVFVFNCKTNQFTPMLQKPVQTNRPTDFETSAIGVDEAGNVWVWYTGFGVTIYDRDTHKIRTTYTKELFGFSPSASVWVSSICKDASGQMIIAGAEGARICRLNMAADQLLVSSDFGKAGLLRTSDVSLFFTKPDGNFYACVTGYGLMQISSDFKLSVLLSEPARIAETDWTAAVSSMIIDDRNNVWLGCEGGLGVFADKPSPFTPFIYDGKSGIKLDRVRSLFVDNDGTKLVGLQNGLIEINAQNGGFTRLDNQHLYHHLLKEGEDGFFLGREDGLFLLRGRSVKPAASVYPELRSMPGIVVNSHVNAGDTLLIFGTENEKGIVVWNRKTKSVRRIHLTSPGVTLGSDIVNNVYQDSIGNLWVLSDNLITVINPALSQSRIVEIQTQPAGSRCRLFFDMCEANGFYWILSYGSGILKLGRDFLLQEHINSTQGLSNDAVYQVFKTAERQLLVTSNNGLSLIDTKSGVIKNYFQYHGLHSNSFEEVAGFSHNSIIYAGGINGFTAILPARITVNTVPPSVFYSRMVMRRSDSLTEITNLQLEELVVPADITQVDIHLSVLNYPDTRSARVFYRIREQGDNWIDNGNAGLLPLIGFSHGTYHLEVQAKNEDGVFSEIRSLTLVFLPKWYQTWWFKLLIGLVAAGLAYTFYRMRISQFKKEEKIRSQLASDLHDDLGSTLNSIKVYSNLALMEKDNEEHLVRIKQGTQDAIAGVKDIIWVLDDQKDKLGDILDRTGQFFVPLCKASGVLCSFAAAKEVMDVKLTKNEKRNLYMILKESINNSLKYACCQAISVTAEKKEKGLQVVIADNGTGFSRGEVAGGHGLKNIENRSKAIGWNAAIVSAAGEGTKIIIEKT